MNIATPPISSSTCNVARIVQSSRALKEVDAHKIAINFLLLKLESSINNNDRTLNQTVQLICNVLSSPEESLTVCLREYSDLCRNKPAYTDRFRTVISTLNTGYDKKLFSLNLANMIDRVLGIGVTGRKPILGKQMELCSNGAILYEQLKEAIKDVRQSCLPPNLASEVEPVAFARQLVATIQNNSRGGPFGGIRMNQYVGFMHHFYTTTGVYPDQDVDVQANDVQFLERLRDVVRPLKEIRVNHNKVSDKVAKQAKTQQLLRDAYADAIVSRDFIGLVDSVYDYVRDKCDRHELVSISLAIEGMSFNSQAELISEGHGFVMSFYNLRNQDGTYGEWAVIDNLGAGCLSTPEQVLGQNRIRPSIHYMGTITKKFITDLFKIQANVSRKFNDNIVEYKTLIHFSEQNPRPNLPDSLALLNHEWMYKKEMRDGSCVSKSHESAYKGKSVIRMFCALLEKDISCNDASMLAVQLTFVGNRGRKQHRDTFLYALGNMDAWSLQDQQHRSALVGPGYISVVDTLETKLSRRRESIYNMLCMKYKSGPLKVGQLASAEDMRPIFESSDAFRDIVHFLNTALDRDERYRQQLFIEIISAKPVEKRPKKVETSQCVVM